MLLIGTVVCGQAEMQQNPYPPRLILIVSHLTLSQSSSVNRGQSQSQPVAEILRPALQKIKNSPAPILLPTNLPASVDVKEIHLVDGEVKSDGWEISLYYKEGCGNACFVGFFQAKRGEKVDRDEADKVVRLANGVRGYYTARSCGGSCTPPQISWLYKGVLFTVQFNVNNKTGRQNEAEIIGLANSAIRGGPR